MTDRLFTHLELQAAKLLTPTIYDNVPSTAIQMDEFTRLFGPEGTEIDFSRPSGKSGYPLLVPEPTDDFDVVIKKVEAIAKVVVEGKSAAVFTGDLNATHGEWDAEVLAIEAMDHVEKMQYSRWKKGISLPAMDWNKNVKAIPADPEALSRYKIRAAAVARAWRVPAASPGNASWIFSNLPHCKPLISAVTKLQEKERYLTERTTKLGYYELAEGKTIRRVTDVVTDALNERVRRINRAKETLRARENALKRNEAARNSTKDQSKEQPKVVGDSRPRPEMENRAQTIGGEERRAETLGVKEEPWDNSAGKRPRNLSDTWEGPPINSPRGPKRTAQMGRRGGSFHLPGSRG